MPGIEVHNLQADLPFGARILGATQRNLADPGVRQQINEVFEQRGLIVFENVEPSSEMHLAVSAVFGPLKEHPIKIVNRVDTKLMPGVIEIAYDKEKSTIVEVDGRERVNWLPWHFDHCYNNELNRAGVLRAIEIPPEEGRTVFGDGIQLYRSFSPELRERIEQCNILYRFEPDCEIRFARPESLGIVRADPTAVLEIAKSMPRAIHPAVWSRASGEKVLHVSPWMAVGIEGQAEEEAHALLEAVSREIVAKVQAYYHSWHPADMLIWDNWRMIHSVTGSDPRHDRLMHRTTIKGDYGLGRWETVPASSAPVAS